MTQAQPGSRIAKTDFLLRDLLEEIAVKTEDLRGCMEGIQELAGEMAVDPGAELQTRSLMRLQVLDSICQRVAALPDLVRALKTGVPAELRIDSIDTIRAFSASMRSFQGAAICSRPENADEVGDFEFWKT